ncbi:hypothetical protein NUW58_g9410 [Xylaria curta]|uniref:Uncharacterized protein n=1 Tax=Xylaria curta TaxID=42375 RepID=A0ACC1MXJ2_9PEZI|nr:hypothetical protein NUW58_g9410 [Xylaria curta]
MSAARQAIFLLDNLLSTRSSNPREPAYCPPPSQISLLCSIIVHPDFTTRPKEPDWPHISLQSLVYLRDLLAVFGPLNAAFKESVLFVANAISDPDSEAHSALDGGLDVSLLMLVCCPTKMKMTSLRMCFVEPLPSLGSALAAECR